MQTIARQESGKTHRCWRSWWLNVRTSRGCWNRSGRSGFCGSCGDCGDCGSSWRPNTSGASRRCRTTAGARRRRRAATGASASASAYARWRNGDIVQQAARRPHRCLRSTDKGSKRIQTIRPRSHAHTDGDCGHPTNRFAFGRGSPQRRQCGHMRKPFTQRRLMRGITCTAMKSTRQDAETRCWDTATRMA